MEITSGPRADGKSIGPPNGDPRDLNSASLLSHLLYTFCRALISPGSRESDQSRAYFEYEVKKSPSFDRLFDVDVAGKIVLEIGCNVGGYMWHALTKGARFMYGVEIDCGRAQACEKILHESYDGDNYMVLNEDARDLHMVDDNSIDLVVSDAVLEHIQDVQRMFSEVTRILKPGGIAHIATSPIWFTYNGGHLWRYIPIPWAHVLFPDRVILEVLNMQRSRGDFSKAACDNIIGLYRTIGRLSLKMIRQTVARTGLQLVSLRNVSRSPVKRFLIRFRLLEEVFAGGILITLAKPE